MFLFAPIIGIFGAFALVAVFGFTVILPLFTVMLAISGNYLWAALTAATWLAWLRFGGPVRRFVFEGFEHGSL